LLSFSASSFTPKLDQHVDRRYLNAVSPQSLDHRVGFLAKNTTSPVIAAFSVTAGL